MSDYKQWRVNTGGKLEVSDEKGNFHPVTPEHVTHNMTPSPATTGWAEEHKQDRAAADQEDDQ